MKPLSRILCYCLSLLTVFSTTAFTEDSSSGSPRYIILMIGDGMGQEYMDLVRESEQARRQDPKYPLAMDALPVRTEMKTLLHGKYITDSAASGTAIACGEHHHMNAVSVGRDKKTPLRTVVDVAEKQNWKTGILTTMSLDDATPACFYAHAANRKNYPLIAAQLFESPVDFIGGGGFKAAESGDLPDWQENAAASGWTLLQTPESLEKTAAGTKVLAVNHRLDAEAGLPSAREQNQKDFTLARLTKEALRLLKNDQGILLIVEGGKIDKAGHSQDVKFALQETLDFDRAVKEALAFQALHAEDTLLIVTSDHETGGLTRTETGFRFKHGRHSARTVPLLSIGPGSKRLNQDLTNVELGQVLKDLIQKPGHGLQ